MDKSEEYECDERWLISLHYYALEISEVDSLCSNVACKSEETA